MSRVCQICGRGPQVGHNISHAHNVSKRRFEINLQRVRVLVDGSVKHMRVCTTCIQGDKIVRPPVTLRKRKHRVYESQIQQAVSTEVMDDQPIGRFFTEASVVSRIFKPKPKPGEQADEEQEAKLSIDTSEDKVESAIPEGQETEPEDSPDDKEDSESSPAEKPDETPET